MVFGLKETSPHPPKSLICPAVLELSSVTNQMLPLDNGEAASAIVASPNLQHLPSSSHVGTAYVLNQHHQLFSPHQRGSTDTPTATSSGAAYTSGVEIRHCCCPEMWGLLLLLLLLLPSSGLRRTGRVSGQDIVCDNCGGLTAFETLTTLLPPELVQQNAEEQVIVVVSLHLKRSPSIIDLAVAAVITNIIVVVPMNLKHPLSSSYTTAIIV